MTDVLDVVGLVALTVAGFLLALWLGFMVVGGGCLWVSWSVTHKRRRAAEVAEQRRAARLARVA